MEQLNYLEIYIYDKWNTVYLPDLIPGMKLKPESIMLHAGTTSAPPLLSEADLISTMDKNGIGSTSNDIPKF